jgi:RsiW-degrading membrane proteinase PrsW (M82 family)
MTAIGFATFENICYLSQKGAENFFYLLIRGFGTGAMHVICEAFIGLGILYLWDRKLIQVAGTVGLLAIAITFHGIYNILVSQTGIPARIGYIMPLITTLFIAFYGNRHAR